MQTEKTGSLRLQFSRELHGSLLLGITGSVGAVVMPQFVVGLRCQGIERVRVLMSAAACKFVTPYAMQLHSGQEVFTDCFAHGEDILVPHIEVTRQADLFVVMPATANVLGKAANGICDDLISTVAVAASCPVMFVPSMNSVMWENPVVQKNIQTLRDVGHTVLEPAQGIEISNLEPTFGCMPPLTRVTDEIARLLSKAVAAKKA